MSHHLVSVGTGEDGLLDATHATVLDFGVRRTTLSEVAKRAGVSRMTVYRRHPDGAGLIRALMHREFGAVLTRALADVCDRGTVGERLVAACVRTVELLVTHPLLLRLLEVDPELLLPYVTGAPGRFQEEARATLREAIASGQADGSVRAGDPTLLAATAETAGRGLVLAARSLDDSQREAGLRELELLLAGYLLTEGGRGDGPRGVGGPGGRAPGAPGTTAA
ncbi:MAG: TetR/AcrR family transcriptional regulator [Actinomycetota bacterium]|nr:TetR/AcrR family transcriptional regulator [Solirubrobacterales bacterium]MBA3860512.1 TetR/AcrR family transcriptional regulator [Solirubrobacterales bacterium]MDQ3409799.1 TetR/AcrR family transcriptional regulator [Actinomycetota bacterium]